MKKKKWKIRIFLLFCESKILIKVSYFLFLNVVLEKLVEKIWFLLHFKKKIQLSNSSKIYFDS